jgi:hypothetical protein
MTCEQFRAAVKLSPSQSTRAERAVVVKHGVTCDACRKHMDDTAAAILAQMSPAAALLAVVVCRLSADAITAGDQSDPEYRAVVGLG